MKPVILSTHALHPEAAALLAPAAELRIASGLAAEALIAEAAPAEIVIVRAPLPPALFAAAPHLRAAIRHGAGTDMIPVAAATAAGVLVANVPGVNARSVAEHVAFAMLALSRRFRRLDRDLRRDGWLAGRAHAESGRELAGRSVGLVGFGHVGRAVHAVAARGFGMRVLVHTPRAPELPDGAVLRPLDALMAEADFVVLCCPLTDATRGLIDAARIARMRPDAYLINVARGPVLDEAALLAALREERIAGAALDVFAEQPLPADHPLLTLDTVLLTPHLAGITDESMARMGRGAVEEALRVLRGELPVNLVNPAVVPAYRARRDWNA